MPALQIAVQLAALRLPLKKALLAAARLGATAVEIDARQDVRPHELSATGLRELLGMLEELNLRVASVAFPTRRGYDTLEGLDRRVTATKQTLKFAYQLRAPFVVNQIGRVPSEPSGPTWELLMQVLGDLSQTGQHVGARLAAQTGSESGPELARLLAALPPQGIGVDFDPGTLLVNGFSVQEAIEQLAGDVVSLRARDAVHDLARKRGLEVPLGRGSVDFAALLGALEERTFRGYCIVARENAVDPELEIGSAVKYLQNL